MRRYIVNYAGAWLCGFAEAPRRDPKIPNYVPVWGHEAKAQHFGDLAISIADIVRRGGVDCSIIACECKTCGGKGWWAKFPLNGDPPEQELCGCIDI